ncbi:MAG TPA: HEAT repeat domain-containing protein [Verrucomicrobiales bacterium]|nr:HEAT repeat domain-containing protein [Verrucomicrobiales bacterium]HIL72501.1 HEAT repeat domain-containing protein [Verrucomicrobiota bacterium]
MNKNSGRKKRSIYFKLLILTISVSAAYLYFPQPENPAVQGRSMGEWLSDMDYSHPPAVREKAEQVILNMGSKGSRILGSLLAYADSYPKKMYRHWYPNLPFSIQIKLKLPTEPVEEKKHILGILKLFGKEAAIAMPHLIKILSDPKQSALHEMVLAVLFEIGPEAKKAIPAIVDSILNESLENLSPTALLRLTNGSKDPIRELSKVMNAPSPRLRTTVAETFAKMIPTPTWAIPLLVDKMNDPDDLTCGTIIWAMGRLGPESFQGLSNGLDSDRFIVRMSSILALRDLGSAALPALKKLNELQSDPNAQIQGEAIKTIQMISDSQGTIHSRRD